MPQRTTPRRGGRKPPLAKYRYPDAVVTGAMVATWSARGVDYEEDEAVFTGRLDAQKAAGKKIFGGGYLVPPERAAAARAAQKQAAEAREWTLSAREREIVEALRNGGDGRWQPGKN
ncbi:MAG: hypothetical protein LIO54_03595 [Oscillospiraceae bacterium]|nr:hypothetical protein [Oscillospiraceae bacterium]